MQVFPLNHLQSAVHLHAVSPMQMRLFIMAAEHNWGFPHWNNHSAVSDRPLCQLDMKKTPRWESTSSAQDDADMGTCQWQDARSLVQSCPVFRRESKSSDIESHRIPAQLCSAVCLALGFAGHPTSARAATAARPLGKSLVVQLLQDPAGSCPKCYQVATPRGRVLRSPGSNMDHEVVLQGLPVRPAKKDQTTRQCTTL